MRNLSHILLTVILLLGQHFHVWSQSDKDFEIVRQDEKITLYEFWTPFPGTTVKARQVKGVFEVAASLSEMHNAIHNEQQIRAWQENILEYNVIPKSDTTWTVYSLTEIPWPLSDQDYLLNYTLVKKNEKLIFISFEHNPSVTLVPLREDADRTPTVGSWRLEKITEQKTKVTYIVTSMPVDYPRFITDRIVRNKIMDTIKKLIEVAEKKKN